MILIILSFLYTSVSGVSHLNFCSDVAGNIVPKCDVGVIYIFIFIYIYLDSYPAVAVGTTQVSKGFLVLIFVPLFLVLIFVPVFLVPKFCLSLRTGMKEQRE